MQAIGGAKCVLRVVRRIVKFLGIECLVVALLQLDRAASRPLCSVEHLLAEIEISLMVVTDLGNDIAIGVIRNADAVNNKLSQCKLRGKERLFALRKNPVPFLFRDMAVSEP